MFENNLTLSVFNGLKIEEQVKEVNKFLDKGLSLNQFGKGIGIDEGGIRKRFKKAGYARRKEGKKLFELTKNLEQVPKDFNQSNKKESEKKFIINGSGDMDEFAKRLIFLEGELKAVKKELKQLNGKSIIDKKEALTIQAKGMEGDLFNPREFNSDLKQISYRYNLEVLEKLDEVCKKVQALQQNKYPK